jgi:Tfp pilus assembly protein PilX
MKGEQKKMAKRDEGQALILVLMLLFIFSLLGATVVKEQSDRLQLSGIDMQHQAAVVAAENGLEAFLAALSQYPGYAYDCQILANKGANVPCNGKPVSLGNGQYFSLTISPSNWLSICQNITSSSCTIQLNVKGTAGNGSLLQTSNAEATLYEPASTFLNYAYYTNYETEDPSDAYGFNNTTLANQYCPYHVWQPNSAIVSGNYSIEANGPANNTSSFFLSGKNGPGAYGPDYYWYFSSSDKERCQQVALATTDILGGIAPFNYTGTPTSNQPDVYSNDPITIGCGQSPTLPGPWTANVDIQSPVFNPSSFYVSHDPWADNSPVGPNNWYRLGSGTVNGIPSYPLKYGDGQDNNNLKTVAFTRSLGQSAGSCSSTPTADIVNAPDVPSEDLGSTGYSYPSPPNGLGATGALAMATGCVYFGPTQIILGTNTTGSGSNDTMWVYSPNTTSASSGLPTATSNSSCGSSSCFATLPGCKVVGPPSYFGTVNSGHLIWVANVPAGVVPQNCPNIGGEVIALDNVNTSFSYCSLGDAIVHGSDQAPPGSSACPGGSQNPYLAPQAPPGDSTPGVPQSGAFDGRWTIATQNNIIIAGNLLYDNCTGVADSTHSLGLAATNDVEINHPLNPVNICNLLPNSTDKAVTLSGASWSEPAWCSGSGGVNDPAKVSDPDPIIYDQTDGKWYSACPYDVPQGNTLYDKVTYTSKATLRPEYKNTYNWNGTNGTYSPYQVGQPSVGTSDPMQVVNGSNPPLDCGTAWNWVWVNAAILTARHSFLVNNHDSGASANNKNFWGCSVDGNCGYGEIRGVVAQNYRGFFAIMHRTFMLDPNLANPNISPPAFPEPVWNVVSISFQ